MHKAGRDPTAFALVVMVLAVCLQAPPKGSLRATAYRLSAADEEFLDEIEKAGFLFFQEQANANTGLVKDRAWAKGGADGRDVASIASTGFGLTVFCVADERGWMPRNEARKRVLAALTFVSKRLPGEHGFYYHFVKASEGGRVWDCEISSIDTGLLLCGVLTCRQYFDDTEIRELASRIYERADWPWMTNGGTTLTMGWKPENGFIESRWDSYNEALMLYLLAIGSGTHPLPASAWKAFRRPTFQYDSLRYIESGTPLFVHQYSHAWFDFRGTRDAYADYFENSVLATTAHRLFCIRLHQRFPDYSEDLWGISASDSARGYVAWGGPPVQGPVDGTLVPAAAGGSIPFLPQDTIRTLRSMRDRFGKKIWKRYGFVDAFNPLTGWVDPDVIGIDVGITVLMAENMRSRFVWLTFMKNPEAIKAMDLAGFKPSANPAAP